VEPRNEIQVFAVEDSPVFVSAIRDLLSEIPGVSMAGWSGGAAHALEEIERLAPDVVIVDLQLESGTGFDVLRALKRMSGGKPVKIVFSSSIDPAGRRLSERLGADFVFDKSADYNRLAEVVRSIAMASAPAAGGDGLKLREN
jgi:DNA-binding NarL/FixJ family response regulator